MLRHVTVVRCMLFDVMHELYLTNVATDTVHVHCKRNNRRKVARDNHNFAKT